MDYLLSNYVAAVLMICESLPLSEWSSLGTKYENKKRKNHERPHMNGATKSWHGCALCGVQAQALAETQMTRKMILPRM